MAAKSRTSATRGSRAKKAKATGKRRPARRAAAKPGKHKAAAQAAGKKKKKSPVSKAKATAKPLKKKKKLRAARTAKKGATSRAGSSKAKKTSQKTAPRKARAKATAKKSPKKRAPTPVAKPKRRVEPRRKAPPPRPIVVSPTPQQIAERQAAQRQATQYEKAVDYFNNRRFSYALSWFQKVVQGPNVTLRHRARIHMEICRRQTEATKVRLRTVDDYYNYGVKLINDRRLEEAEEHLQHALKMAPKADHVHYANAVVGALKGDPEGALVSLKRAIELNAGNRVLARSDADLSSIKHHPSIAELLFPGAAGEETA